MSASPKLCLLASPARPVSSERSPQPTSRPILTVAKAIQPKQGFAQAKSMQEIGRRLLQSVGFASPDDVSIQAAIEANDAFIAQLEQIRDRVQGLTIDQDD